MKFSVHAIILITLCFQSSAFCAVLDTIDAIVNGELILSGEVDDIMKQETNVSTLSEEQITQARRNILRSLIDNLLILQAARNQLPEETRNAIADEMEKRTAFNLEQQRSTFKSPDDLKRFEQQMGGMRWEEIRRLVSRQIERAYLKNTVAPQLARKTVTPPTPQELEEFKRQNPEKSPTDEIEIARLLLSFPPNAANDQIAAVQNRAQELSIRARNGEQFEDLVLQYSQDETSKSKGGNLGSFKKETINPDFVFLFDKPEGFISDPVQTSAGMNIFKVVNIPSWDEVYIQAKHAENVDEWIKEIRKEAKIEIRYDEVLQKELNAKNLQ